MVRRVKIAEVSRDHQMARLPGEKKGEKENRPDRRCAVVVEALTPSSHGAPVFFLDKLFSGEAK